mgnify:CR=1 FL=1
MLTILPEKDKQKSDERLSTAYGASGYEKGSGQDPALLVVREGGKELGYIAVDADSGFSALRLHGLQGYGCKPVGILRNDDPFRRFLWLEP